MTERRIDIGGLFSPWCITILVWCAIGVLFLLFGDKLYDLTDQFYISLLLWCGTLIPISIATYNLLPDKLRSSDKDGIAINSYIYWGLFAITIMLVPLHIHGVLSALASYNFENFLKGLRDFAVHGEYTSFPRYGYVLSHTMLIVSLWAYPRIPKWAVAISICLALAEALLIMEKGGIFFVMLCCLFTFYERGLIRLQTIAISGFTLFFLFWCMNALREGMTDEMDSDFAFDFLGMYIMSPSVAFCRAEEELGEQFGANTFETIYLFLHRFGANVEVHEKVQDFVYVPVTTNVYTVMQPFFRDFGYVGVGIFGTIYGVISGMLYRFMRNGNGFATCLYTYMMTMLVLQFYQESIFQSMVYVLQLVFFIWLCTQTIVRIK